MLLAEDSSLILTQAEYDDPIRDEEEYGTWYVFYKQQYFDIPVYNSVVKVIIMNQRIVVIGSDYYPDFKVDPNPIITDKQAVMFVNDYLELRELF